MRGNYKNGHEAHKASYFMIVSYRMLAYNEVSKLFFLRLQRCERQLFILTAAPLLLASRQEGE